MLKPEGLTAKMVHEYGERYFYVPNITNIIIQKLPLFLLFVSVKHALRKDNDGRLWLLGHGLYVA